MIHPLWMKASLEGLTSGCNRLQICVFLARFCRVLPSYLVDIFDVEMDPVQFETRHPPHEARWSCRSSSLAGISSYALRTSVIASVALRNKKVVRLA